MLDQAVVIKPERLAEVREPIFRDSSGLGDERGYAGLRRWGWSAGRGKSTSRRRPSLTNKVSRIPSRDVKLVFYEGEACGSRSKCKRDLAGVHGCVVCIMQASVKMDRQRNVHTFSRCG